MDFDETRLYYSHQQLQSGNDDDAEGAGNEPEQVEAESNEDEINLQACHRHFREFLRTFKLA